MTQLPSAEPVLREIRPRSRACCWCWRRSHRPLRAALPQSASSQSGILFWTGQCTWPEGHAALGGSAGCSAAARCWTFAVDLGEINAAARPPTACPASPVDGYRILNSFCATGPSLSRPPAMLQHGPPPSEFIGLFRMGMREQLCRKDNIFYLYIWAGPCRRLNIGLGGHFMGKIGPISD